MCRNTTFHLSLCTDSSSPLTQPATSQKEFANNDTKNQHCDQVYYGRLRGEGRCINRQWWWGHARWLLCWCRRCWVGWSGTGNLAQSYTILLDTYKTTLPLNAIGNMPQVWQSPFLRWAMHVLYSIGRGTSCQMLTAACPVLTEPHCPFACDKRDDDWRKRW